MSRVVRLAGPGKIEVATVTPPEPGPGEGEALVRLRLGGICGSDLAAYRGTSPLVTYPRILGHELVVDILEAPDAPQWAHRRAVVEPLLACGTCRVCRQGRYNCCPSLHVMGVHVDGGFQEVMTFPLNRLHAVPDALPDELAVLAEPLSIAYRAVQRSAIEAGRIAVVFGAGTIGLLIAQLLIRGRGCRAVVIDTDRFRLERAEALGATPLQGDFDTLVKHIAETTDGEMADVVFEATGAPACTRMTTDLVAHGGTIVLIGWNPGPVEVDTVTLMRKEVDLRGSRNSSNAFPAVLRLLEDGVVDADQLITHRFPLTKADQALDLLDQAREPALKVLLTVA